MNLFQNTVVAFIFTVILTQGYARAADAEDKVSVWKGYQRIDFKLGSQDCFLVAPKTPAEGKPWVWRARFPGFHSEIDIELLKRGFHIAHINTAGMLGSPTAMEHWDKFYDHMTGERGLAKRMAIEAISRGGLFAYRWTSRHPQRVTCIYADTPVCDFKSWPGGRGKGVGSAVTWKNLLKQYQMTEQQALEFKENPIDVLAPIAKQGVPLMNIVSENDRVVPPDENTYVLQKRYEKLGGKMSVTVVKEGTEKSKGHHFTLLPEHIKRAVEFIVANR